MFTYNLSKDKVSYSQRNNEIKPLESCNVTSMVMALSYIGGYLFPMNGYAQPEDSLRAFIESKGQSPENHNALSKLTNEWLNKKVTHFSSRVKIDTIIDDIKRNIPVVISGNFPGYPIKRGTPLGHIICIVGMECYHEDSKRPVSFIIDDPYGNTMDNWKGSGNDIVIPYELFMDWTIKEKDFPDSKWAHRFYV
jgi:hypothetical protein